MKNEQNAPKIRFKGFTDAWELRELGDIVGIYDGVHQTPNYQNSGIMFLSVENIATLKSSKFISEEDFKRDYKVYPQENDILMTRIGDVGTTNVVTDNGLKAYYVSLALLKYKGTDPYFLSNAIQSDYVQKGLANRTLKTAIPMKINKDEIGKVSVMLPLSATEQQQIGTYFRTLDHLITLHQRKCETLQKLKKSMLQKMFPKNGSCFPEIRFAGFTDAWEQRELGECMETVTDYVAAGSFADIAENVQYKTFPDFAQLIRTVDLKHEFKNNDYIYVDKKAFDYLWKVNLNVECIILPNIGANIGEVYYIEPSSLPYENNVLGPNAIFLKAKDSTKFMYTLLQADDFQNKLYVSIASSGQPKFNKTELKAIKILIPNSAEQEKIGAYFRTLDHLITLHQRKLETLKKLKKAMLQKMFI